MNDDIIMAIAKAFQARGKQFYLVGGTVRDELLGRESHDIDATTDALPKEIKEIVALTSPAHIVPIGEQFGTIQIIYGDNTIIEITTFRGERYNPGSRKPVVEFSKFLVEDLARRDFTINALARNPLTGEIIDPFNGQKALRSGIICAVLDPEQRFLDDPLRMLRATRFVAQFLGEVTFSIAPETWHSIAKYAGHINDISQERIREELNKILVSNGARYGFSHLLDLGLMHHILPEVEVLYGVEQLPHHHCDVYQHTMIVVSMVPNRLALRWAALLHDIAKPATKTVDTQGSTHFYEHEDIGANMARDILTRLRFSSDMIERIVKIVSMHMRTNQYIPAWSKASVRRFVVAAGDAFDDLLDLAIADGASDRDESLAEVTTRIDHLRVRAQQICEEAIVHPLVCPLSGDELMAHFGRPPGPWIKQIKTYLLEQVLDGALQSDDKDAAWQSLKVHNKLVDIRM